MSQLQDPGLQEPGCPPGGAGTPELSRPERWPGQTGACLEPTPHPQTREKRHGEREREEAMSGGRHKRETREEEKVG